MGRFKGLRGSAFDPFGWMDERRTERRLRDEYLATVGDILTGLGASNLNAAVALASYPEEIRGYGPVKNASIARAQAKATALRSRFVEGRPRGLITAA